MQGTSPGDNFAFTVFTADAGLAARLDAAGVDRIGVDVERFGKAERQSSRKGAWLSDHTLEDLSKLRPAVKRGQLFARLDPINPRSQDQIEKALEYGAQVVMLPFFRTAGEVEKFVRRVDGRASVSLLLESTTAAFRLHDILRVGGVADLMIGLNDLHIAAGLSNHFEVVASDVLTAIAERCHAAGLPFGFGGLGRALGTGLPIDADLIVAQHARLGSTRAFLARSFLGADPMALDLPGEVRRLRERISYWKGQPEDELRRQQEVLRDRSRTFFAP